MVANDCDLEAVKLVVVKHLERVAEERGAYFNMREYLVSLKADLVKKCAAAFKKGDMSNCRQYEKQHKVVSLMLA